MHLALLHKLTSKKAAVVAGPVVNELWQYTVLLLHLEGANGANGPYTDSSPSAHTVTRQGSNGTLSTTRKKFGESGFLGASTTSAGDGLNATGTLTDFTFGTGDFDVCGQFYFGQSFGVNQTIFDWRGTNGPNLYADGAGSILFNNGTSNIISVAHGMAINNWYFVQLSRKGGTLRLFIDRVEKAAVADATNYSIGTTMRIGYGPAGTMLQGGMDEIRILKGYGYAVGILPTGVFPEEYLPESPSCSVSSVTIPEQSAFSELITVAYTYTSSAYYDEDGTTFQWYRADDGAGTNAVAITGATSASYTVSGDDADKFLACDVTPAGAGIVGPTVRSNWSETSMVNPLWQFVVLQISLDGTNGDTGPYADASDSAHSVARTETTGALSTAQKKFGTAAFFGGASNSGLTVTGTLTDFTFGTGDFDLAGFFYHSSLGSVQTVFDWRGTGGPTLYTNTGTMIFHNGVSNIISAAHGMSINTWNFIQLSRVSGVTRLFINGVQIGASATDTRDYAATGVGMRIGHGPAGNMLNAGFDDIRILKGYGFTTSVVPTAPWPGEFP